VVVSVFVIEVPLGVFLNIVEQGIDVVKEAA
jgi:hypothetical protein